MRSGARGGREERGEGGRERERGRRGRTNSKSKSECLALFFLLFCWISRIERPWQLTEAFFLTEWELDRSSGAELKKKKEAESVFWLASFSHPTFISFVSVTCPSARENPRRFGSISHLRDCFHRISGTHGEADRAEAGRRGAQNDV